MPEVAIAFECPDDDCDGIVEETLFVSDPDYSAEVHSDGDAITDEHVTCPECGTDYTVNLVNHMGMVSAELPYNRDTRVTAKVNDEPDYYFEDYDPPSNAFEQYDSASVDLRKLLSRNPSEPEDGILYRMIFSQFIAVFEAFLTDRLLREAIDHLEIRSRLAKLPTFSTTTVSISDVVVDPDIGWKKMRERLQAQLYHKLDEVRKLYQIAFHFDMFASEAEKDIIASAVAKRHDCVHRNGKDKSDVMNRFPTSSIIHLQLALHAVVQRVEDGVTRSIDRL